MTAADATMFDGETFDETLDGSRLSRQLDRVLGLMRDGRWRTLNQIRIDLGAAHDSVPAISARLRDLRKPKNGGWAVESRRNPQLNGLWEYRVTEAPGGSSEPSSRKTPPKPTPDEVKQALVDLQQSLGRAHRAGYKLQNPVAVRRLGLWLRHMAGEDVTEALERDAQLPTVDGSPQ